jgi:hypothetical protein
MAEHELTLARVQITELDSTVGKLTATNALLLERLAIFERKLNDAEFAKLVSDTSAPAPEAAGPAPPAAAPPPAAQCTCPDPERLFAEMAIILSRLDDLGSTVGRLVSSQEPRSGPPDDPGRQASSPSEPTQGPEPSVRAETPGRAEPPGQAEPPGRLQIAVGPMTLGPWAASGRGSPTPQAAPSRGAGGPEAPGHLLPQTVGPEAAPSPEAGGPGALGHLDPPGLPQTVAPEATSHSSSSSPTGYLSLFEMMRSRSRSPAAPAATGLPCHPAPDSYRSLHDMIQGRAAGEPHGDHDTSVLPTRRPHRGRGAREPRAPRGALGTLLPAPPRPKASGQVLQSTLTFHNSQPPAGAPQPPEDHSQRRRTLLSTSGPAPQSTQTFHNSQRRQHPEQHMHSPAPAHTGPPPSAAFPRPPQLPAPQLRRAANP